MTLRRRDNRHIQALRQIELFAGCPPVELQALDHVTTPASLPPGHVLCREGEFGNEAFVIVEGEASVAVHGAEVARLGPGTFCGEMALLDSTTRAATVTAATPMKVLVLSRTDFGQMLHLAPTVTRRMLQEVSRRLRAIEHAGTQS